MPMITSLYLIVVKFLKADNMFMANFPLRHLDDDSQSEIISIGFISENYLL